MGPRLVSRGNIRKAVEISKEKKASMGPRLVSRGNTVPGLEGPIVPGWLQWGRDSLVAEIIPRVLLVSRYHARFNGAATR